MILAKETSSFSGRRSSSISRRAEFTAKTPARHSAPAAAKQHTDVTAIAIGLFLMRSRAESASAAGFSVSAAASPSRNGSASSMAYLRPNQMSAATAEKYAKLMRNLRLFSSTSSLSPLIAPTNPLLARKMPAIAL